MDQQQCKLPEQEQQLSLLNRAASPASPIPSSSSNDRKRPFVHMNEVEDVVKDVVAMLGDVLARINDALVQQGDEETRRMRGLVTTYVAFVEAVADDLLHNDNNNKPAFAAYMAIFDPHDQMADDDPLLHHDTLFRRSLAKDIRYRLNELGVQSERLLKCVDTIFARFYTNEAPPQQQKDHGQFYTPQSVVRFMWAQCLVNNNKKHVPRVLDPCMGMGAFLCEFLTRWVTQLQQQQQYQLDGGGGGGGGATWDNAVALQHILCTDIPANIWGVELDPVALRLAKLNILVHLLPLYRRLCQLSPDTIHTLRVHRLHLFCSDTLRLTPRVGDDPWEQCELQRLHSGKLVFDYIVTNPPYMIRKTGRITDPDPALYDTRILGGRGVQAYVYFMWICLQRCDPHDGELCLITPSQWLVLEFARHLRAWIWEHCELLQLFQLEPYKVWPRVQTDSLIFRLRMRGTRPPNLNTHTLFLRHTARRATLQDILAAYTTFNPQQQQQSPSSDIAYKYTPTHDRSRIQNSPNASFAFLSPSTSLTGELAHLTHSLSRLCDGPGAPLVFHRGPNTHPVYALVVRTQWARDYFGPDCCSRWLRPAFYWSGKAAAAGGGTNDPESTFWHVRDPQRLARKETSPAEAYAPFYAPDANYSLLLVDKDGADTLKDHPDDARLYEYLQAARVALQPTREERKVTWCHYNQCGTDVAVKIVHPINCGYFTKSQPRQRFFVDRQQLCVTNQCMYFTLSPETDLSAEFFCGLLNSSTVQFFLREHCAYDQQRRTRFFGRHLANIPCCSLPATSSFEATLMTDLVHAVTTARLWIYAIIWYTDAQHVIEHLRAGTWEIHPSDRPRLAAASVQDVNHSSHTSSWSNDMRSHWISTTLLLLNNTSLDIVLVQLLKLASLFQYGIDQLTFVLYGIPVTLQRALEHELGHVQATARWSSISLDHIFDTAQAILLLLQQQQQPMDSNDNTCTTTNVNIAAL